MSAVNHSGCERLIDTTDWAGTPLGPRESWPPALQTALHMVLHCQLPMNIVWGPAFVQLYNDAYVSVLGHKHPAALGRPAAGTWAEIWDTVLPLLERVRQGESVGWRDFKLRIDRHGYPEDCYFDFSYSPVPDDKGGVGGVLITFVETTERVAMEQRLKTKARELHRLRDESRAREEQLQAVLDSVSTAVITVNEDFHIVLFNRAAETVFRAKASEMKDRSVDELLPERLRGNHQALMAGFARGMSSARAHGVDRELTARRLDGEEFPIEAAISRVRVAGRLLMTIALRDTTEAHDLRRERVARASAEAASEAKSQFLSHLSHELRTPLNAVIGFAQLLQMDAAAANPAMVQKYAGLILTSGQHQLSMVEDLLDLSRIEEHQLAVSIEPVTVWPTLQGCIQMLAARAAAREVTFDTSHAHGCEALVSADAGRLRQILLNLLSNAVKYNRIGGRIEVRCAKVDAEWTRIDISDTGYGIAPHLLGRLFTPFERLGQEKSAIEGTGMGLVLARQLARLMGGDVTVSSQVDTGSTFTAWLPAAPGLAAGVQVRDLPPPGKEPTMTPRSTDQPAGSSGDRSPTEPAAPMAPGDEAPPGSPATGETVCPECGGTGRIGTQNCANCAGTGQVTVGIGGA